MWVVHLKQTTVYLQDSMIFFFKKVKWLKKIEKNNNEVFGGQPIMLVHLRNLRLNIDGKDL